MSNNKKGMCDPIDSPMEATGSRDGAVLSMTVTSGVDSEISLDIIFKKGLDLSHLTGKHPPYSLQTKPNVKLKFTSRDGRISKDISNLYSQKVDTFLGQE